MSAFPAVPVRADPVLRRLIGEVGLLHTRARPLVDAEGGCCRSRGMAARQGPLGRAAGGRAPARGSSRDGRDPGRQQQPYTRAASCRTWTRQSTPSASEWLTVHSRSTGAQASLRQGLPLSSSSSFTSMTMSAVIDSYRAPSSDLVASMSARAKKLSPSRIPSVWSADSRPQAARARCSSSPGRTHRRRGWRRSGARPHGRFAADIGLLGDPVDVQRGGRSGAGGVGGQGGSSPVL